MEHIAVIAKRIAESAAVTPPGPKSSTDPCPLCRGAGYVGRDVPVGHPDFGRLWPCRCIAGDLARRKVERALGRVGMPADQRGSTFDNFYPERAAPLEEPPAGDDSCWADRVRARRRKLAGLGSSLARHMARAKKSCMAYAGEPRDFLVLLGEPGCGKTHLAAAIANARLAAGDAVCFAVIPDLLDSLRATFSKSHRGADYEDVLRAYQDASLLVLDDLGAESPTDWAMEKLYQIANYRYNRRLPTVVTTNEVPYQVDPRLQSRLFDGRNCIFEILAGDYRLRRDE